MLKVLQLFSERIIGDDALFVRVIPLAETEARRTPLAKTSLPSAVTDAGGDPHAEAKKASVVGKTREPTIPNQSEITRCVRIFPNIRIVRYAG